MLQARIEIENGNKCGSNSPNTLGLICAQSKINRANLPPS